MTKSKTSPHLKWLLLRKLDFNSNKMFVWTGIYFSSSAWSFFVLPHRFRTTRCCVKRIQHSTMGGWKRKNDNGVVNFWNYHPQILFSFVLQAERVWGISSHHTCLFFCPVPLVKAPHPVPPCLTHTHKYTHTHTHTHTHTLHSHKRFSAWPLQCHVLPRCVLAIVLHWRDLRGEEEGWEWGIQIGWRSQPWIYVSVTEPFMRRQLPLFLACLPQKLLCKY